MSAKTKRLTKLLFRRSSSVDEPKRLTHGEISYDHQNISYYRTLMTFNEAAVASPSRSRDTQKVRVISTQHDFYGDSLVEAY